MNCAVANQINLVEYLYSLGYQPQKIRDEDYWYLSPLRDEKTSSFKVNKTKNVWYDHGLGKGGNTVDFAMQYFKCGLAEALQKISLFHPQKEFVKEPFQKLQSNLFPEADGTETAIKIIALKQLITDPLLCRYLQKRMIADDIANRYCSEVSYSFNDKIYTAISFRNSAGGYELRSEVFKGSSSPTWITHVDNKANNISVFERFFDYLSYRALHQKNPHPLTNFLILNSLSFFEKSLFLMEKHDHVHLYLDHDNAGRKCTLMAKKRSVKFQDESKFYKGYKDLNECIVKLCKDQKTG